MENSQKTILIAEDDNILRFIVEKKLEKEGYKIIGVEDGNSALKILKETPPDLILLDIYLPGINGFELMSIIKKDLKLKVPIIVLTTSITDSAIEESLLKGAKGYIAKTSFNPDEIVRIINKYLKPEKSINFETSYKTYQSKNEKSILIIEDDKILGNLIFRKLKKLKKYNLMWLTQGDDAYKLLKKRSFDLVLLDLILPGMNGFEILEKLKSTKLFKKSTIVVLSNLSQKDEIQRSLKLGAKDYIIKSNYTLEEIIDKVRKYLE